MNASSRLGTAALLLLPGALTVYLSFNAGGFYPNTQAFVALILAGAFALRIALARAPFEGYGRPVALAAGALALYAVWTAVSGIWSDAPGRAALEADRVVLYLFALLLFASLPRSAAGMEWMLRGLAAGIVVVCVCSLVTRVLPDVWPIAGTIADERLSYPVTYWNALGLLAAIGAILCFHFACSRSEPPVARVLGAAAVPVLTTTVFFTFSRGAIAAGTVGLIAYIAISRPSALLSGLVATVPASAVAIVAGYRADLLATADPTSAAAVDQGQTVALLVGGCAVAAGLVRLLLVRLDAWLSLDALQARAGRMLPFAAGVGAIATLVVLVALGAPGYLGDKYDRFVERGETPVGQLGDPRTRLTDPSNNGRIDQWDVAVQTFRASPLEGDGAGTYQNVWARDRPITLTVRDAHSLYAEVLAELGLVGLALLVLALGTIIVALAVRAGNGRRGPYAAALAILIVWALHAGVDWDWEMPVVTLSVFALGGMALAHSARTSAATTPVKPGLRVAATLACLAVAVIPGFVLVSQDRLDDSADAFAGGDCRAAVDAADSSIAVLSFRPEPYEVRAFCRLRQGRRRDGMRDLERAVDRDPQNWIYRYDLAVARAWAGLDPRPEAAAALRLNPRDAEALEMARRFRRASPREWRSEAMSMLAGARPFYLSAR